MLDLSKPLPEQSPVAIKPIVPIKPTTSKWWCLIGIHEYKIIKEQGWCRECDGIEIDEWTIYTMQCVCCGKLKEQKCS